jgi:hypothetical protein
MVVMCACVFIGMGEKERLVSMQLDETTGMGGWRRERRAGTCNFGNKRPVYVNKRCTMTLSAGFS